MINNLIMNSGNKKIGCILIPLLILSKLSLAQDIDTIVDGKFFNYVIKNDTSVILGNLIKNRKNGTWLVLNQDTCITMEGSYKKNKKHGTWIYYDINNQVRAFGDYNKGKKTGKWYVGGRSYWYFRKDRLIYEAVGERLEQDYYNNCRLKSKK
jgi:hypothetical protein